MRGQVRLKQMELCHLRFRLLVAGFWVGALEFRN